MSLRVGGQLRRAGRPRHRGLLNVSGGVREDRRTARLRDEAPSALQKLYAMAAACCSESTTRSNALHRYDPVANVWTTLTADGAVGSPPARAQSGIAWDAGRARLVVFGGSDNSGVRLGDTWEWDGAAWTNVTPVVGSPSARNFCAMAYDYFNGKVLMFGGNVGGAAPQVNDTWHWDGTSWTQLSPRRRQESASSTRWFRAPITQTS